MQMSLLELGTSQALVRVPVTVQTPAVGFRLRQLRVMARRHQLPRLGASARGLVILAKGRRLLLAVPPSPPAVRQLPLDGLGVVGLSCEHGLPQQVKNRVPINLLRHLDEELE